jgi:hypothetical protein
MLGAAIAAPIFFMHRNCAIKFAYQTNARDSFAAFVLDMHPASAIGALCRVDAAGGAHCFARRTDQHSNILVGRERRR